MDFHENCLKNVMKSFLIWMLLTIFGCGVIIYLNPLLGSENISSIYFSKVIKFVSYAWIATTIFDAIVDIDRKQPVAVHLTVAYRAVFWLTVFISFFIFMQLIMFLANVSNFIKLSPFVDNFIALMPVLALAVANKRIINLKDADNTMKLKHKRFLYLIDLPCIVAAFTLFVFLGFGQLIDAVSVVEIGPVLSGAMAFLVFMTYIIDKFLHHFSEVTH